MVGFYADTMYTKYGEERYHRDIAEQYGVLDLNLKGGGVCSVMEHDGITKLLINSRSAMLGPAPKELLEGLADKVADAYRAKHNSGISTVEVHMPLFNRFRK